MEFAECCDVLSRVLAKDLPRRWDGMAAIKEMRDAGCAHWKQTEWIGWYFQYLCETILPAHMTIPGPAYGNTRFDGFLCVPWDFKAHVLKPRPGDLIVNDREAIERAIGEHGAVGLIVAQGLADYDEDGSFRLWHQALSGGETRYVKERIDRGAPSRRRKTAFTLDHLYFVRMDEQGLAGARSFQQGFRNADGSPRRPKVLLRHKDMASLSVRVVDLRSD
jgi:hypothetical protein